MINNNEFTHIRVAVKTKTELESMGKYGETMDEILQRVLLMAREGKIFQEMKMKGNLQNEP